MSFRLRAPLRDAWVNWLAGGRDGRTATRVSGRRSIAKAITYRVFVVIADFIAVYFLTGALRVAAGFTIISNIYTTVIYIVHERVWARSTWGLNGANADRPEGR
jgi:adenylylsulfate kinase